MDFEFTADQKVIRDEMFQVCQELEKKQPPSWTGSIEDMFDTDEGWEYHRYCNKEFAKRKWLSIDWPVEYQGLGRTKIYQVMFAEARGYHKIQGVDIFATGILAPTLLWFGTEEQKKEFLPPVARAEVAWCQLWSEPEAGSDLANVSTRGVRQGDVYIVNGQKIWTSGGHRSDWGFMVFRTDPNAQPKHRGISYILVDMKTPGIEIRPLKFMNKVHYYNEVFFTDAKIPVKYRIGEENKGWAVTRGAMNAERSGMQFLAGLKRDLEDLVQFCNTQKVDGKPLSANPVIRHKLAEIACDLDAARALAYRIIWMQDEGLAGAMEASACKVFTGDLTVRMSCLGNEILGPFGQVKYSKWAPLRGYYEAMYQTSFAASISAGSNEIQRNLIAWEGLGLPRMR